jgi:DNA-binding LacI/PurR family transcriptional regulator
VPHGPRERRVGKCGRQQPEHGKDLAAPGSGDEAPADDGGDEDAAKERRRIEGLVGRRIDGLIVMPADDESIAALKGKAEGSRSSHGADRPGAEAPGFDTVSADGRIAGCRSALSEAGLARRDRVIYLGS